MFKPYESKPVTRMAFQITDKMHIEKVEDTESTYMCVSGLEHEQSWIEFKAYEEPKTGDWIVRLTESDTYHCTDTVFRKRNIVPE